MLVDTKAILGEGPVWDIERQTLFWVDIEGCKLQEYNPSSGKNRHWQFDEMIGAAVPMKMGTLLLALESGLATFDCDLNKLNKIPVLENKAPKIRFNDGKVGPKGNFWIGTMHKEFLSQTGNLYRVSKNLNTSIAIPKTTISNGMAWSSDLKKFYYIDSPTFEVKAYDFDANSGTILNQKSQFTIPREHGSPDGMCIDADDMLWIAHWGGHCIRRWNPETGEVLQKISVPAPHVTSCCFGGKDLKTMYITTARSGLTASQIKKYPLSGGLFVFKAPIKGTPINYFECNTRV